MNKREYLNRLNERLKEYPESFSNSIIGDIEAHINDGLQNGKSEEQVIVELGSIDELMRTVREEYEDRLSDDDFGAQFYRDGKLEDEVYEYGGQKKLEVISKIGEVHIKKGEVFNLDYDESKFNISYTEDRIILETIKVEGFFNKIINLGSGDVNVTLPDHFDSVNVVLNVGEIHMDNLVLRNATISNNTGDVKIRKCIIDDVVATLNTGDMKMNGTFRYVNANSSLGDVNITNKGELEADISNSMGDVKVKLLNENNGFRLTANSNMGSIKVKYNGLNLKANSRMEYECGEAISDLRIRTSAGDIKIR